MEDPVLQIPEGWEERAPDGWEWKYGLDPLDASTLGDNGATGDPDGDNLPNLQEYEFGMAAKPGKQLSN